MFVHSRGKDFNDLYYLNLEEWYKREWIIIFHQNHSSQKGLTLLWPGVAIWWYGTKSTLTQVMAWCLMAPSHCLNQKYRLTICKIHWLSSDGNFTMIPQPSITKIGLIINHPKFHSDLPGTNELISYLRLAHSARWFLMTGGAQCQVGTSLLRQGSPLSVVVNSWSATSSNSCKISLTIFYNVMWRSTISCPLYANKAFIMNVESPYARNCPNVTKG